MAFSRYFGTLEAGAVMRAEARFQAVRFPPDRDDPGALYSMASPLQPGAALLTVGQAKRFELGGDVFVYSVQVTNTGGLRTDFELQGGGLT